MLCKKWKEGEPTEKDLETLVQKRSLMRKADQVASKNAPSHPQNDVGIEQGSSFVITYDVGP